MKNLRWFSALLVLAMGASPAFAYRFGNPGKVASKGNGDIGVVLEMGERELDADGIGAGDVDIKGLTVEGRYGIGNGVELRGRLIPMTATWDLDSGVEPRILGLGAAVQWIPGTPKGPLTMGLGLGLDYGKGDDEDVDVDYLDFQLNGGVNYKVNKKLATYGGLALVNSDVTVEGPGGSLDAEMDTPLVIFGGLDFKPADGWILGAEIRLIGESMFSLTGRFNF